MELNTHVGNTPDQEHDKTDVGLVGCHWRDRTKGDFSSIGFDEECFENELENSDHTCIYCSMLFYGCVLQSIFF